MDNQDIASASARNHEINSHYHPSSSNATSITMLEIDALGILF